MTLFHVAFTKSFVATVKGNEVDKLRKKLDEAPKNTFYTYWDKRIDKNSSDESLAQYLVSERVSTRPECMEMKFEEVVIQ